METKVNNSLMKKTKAELVNIILRKDDVEKQLREEISSLNEVIDINTKTISEQADHITSLTHKVDDFENQCDISATNVAELEMENNALKKSNILFIVITIISLIFAFVF